MNQKPTRHIDIKGAFNIRDIGGYPTVQGTETNWQKFIRADCIYRLGEESQLQLINYGARTIIDLRRDEEFNLRKNVFADRADIEFHRVDIAGDDWQDDPISREGMEPRKWIFAIYQRFLDTRAHKFAEALSTLAQPGALPGVYHCEGGQDRTGLISAMLLAIAGVANETIIADYALTAQYRVNYFFSELAPPNVDPAEYTPEVYGARNCPPEAMADTIAYLEAKYGGLEAYVRAAGVGAGQVEALKMELVG